MSNRNNDVPKNGLSIDTIETSDTISQFMEKCNNNFFNLLQYGGGTKGDDGAKGDQGVPTKPKVPIHVWKEGDGEEFQYEEEVSTSDGFEIRNYSEDLTDAKYQEGHLIILENAHVYILENNGSDILRPKFLLALHSYDQADVINGKNAYVHIAYANTPDGIDGFVTDEELRGENNITESVSTYGLQRNTPSTYNNTNVSNMPYMGIYSNDKQTSSSNPDRYTWVRIQGSTGLEGPQGDKGDKGDNFTGQSYTVDLDGDISTISLNVDRTRLYSDDYCKCTLHSYYGQNQSKLTLRNVTISMPKGYVFDGNNVINTSTSTRIGNIQILQSGENDVEIRFIPVDTFVFPETPIVFLIHVKTSIKDTNDQKTYTFNRDVIWTIKGIVSSFELEIIPKYRTIKLFENGEYFPENLLVGVYKTINGKRELFELNDNPSFKLLYKKYDENEWMPYETTGINVKKASTSCLEFKVVKNYGSTNTEEPEEIWDYEDVWVVADGKNTHYYHADLGNTESIMILSTGEKFNIGTEAEPKYCAELRNKNGYSITFDPKFYDGANELTITDVSIGSNSGEIYYNNGTFVRNLTSETIEGVTKYVFTVTQVPYDIETIPMTFNVTGKCPVYDKDGNIEEYIDCVDSIAFNVYISTITNTYTLVPTVSAFNTSTIGSNNTIGCDVYKNNIHIPISKLEKNGLVLKYVVYSSDTDNKEHLNYTEPLVYGDDNDENKFTANDVAIVFLLEYDNKEIVRSTVPLIKDGQNGKDGIDGKDGQNGKDGKDGETPSCIKTTIEGYSTTELPVNSTEWKTTLDELGTLSAGQQIYILNEYTWDNDTTSRGITVTLAGTQGADGKSRVLFYLGSFQDETLKGEKVEGKLDDERCDYYIDSNGDAWMRTGLNESADGYPSGSSLDSTNWKPSTKVGFLQSGAITADMINAQTITSDSGIVTKLFSQEIVSKNLTVDAAQITGTLDANEVNITNLTVDATQITGTLDAQKINTDGLTVSKLNTKPENNKDNISICENYIYCLNGDGRRNLKISSDNINIGCLDALFTPVNSVDVNKYVAINGWTNNNNKWINTNIVLSSQGTVNVNNDETADPVNYNGTCKPIGYVLKDTKFDMTIKISLNYYYWGNSVQPYTKISADKWGITSGTAQGWGKLPVGSSALTNSNLTGGYLLLYKKDENGIYVLVKLYSLSGEWIIENSDSVIFNPNSNFTSGNYRTKHVTDIQIPDDGEYGVELYFEPNSIYYTNTTNPSSNTYLNTRFIINVNRPEQYTEIGKNGLISYNIDTAIALNSDGVILKSKNADDGIYNFYGLKVNKSGIYIGTNTTDWKKLNLDKMIELGIIEDIPE